MTTLPTIAEGARGPVVRWAQYRIAIARQTALDYSGVDGIFGPQTKTSVLEMQAYLGIATDGVIGPVTWSGLHGDAPQPPTLSDGSDGASVKSLQNALNEFVAPNPLLVLDGSFGPLTRAAVKTLQQRAGIATDGIAGLQTYAVPIAAAGMLFVDLCGFPES